MFVDRVQIEVAAGNGGRGCKSFRREKYVPLGGPDGGNGGDGGSVIMRAQAGVDSLAPLAHRKQWRAPSGDSGGPTNCHGRMAADLVLLVPPGTVVIDETTGLVLKDLATPGDTIVAAKGGQGGWGNLHFKSSTNRAPRETPPGEQGEARRLLLELKVIADVGLVGKPNAGKSSLIRRISNATPKVADYPFTTLVPNLGVVTAGEAVFTVADVPGLIPGASEGKGLGLEFLRHVERCSVLVHVLDCATMEPGRDPIDDLDVIEAELAAYGGLLDRPRLVALNKIDVPDARTLADMVRPILEERGLQVFEISAATREGLRPLSFARAALVMEARRASIPDEEPRIVIKPRAVNDTGFEVLVEPDGYRIRGERPERWVRQTDFSNDEAVGYLADRLARLGVEEALYTAGATPGATVMIGGEENAVVFDWQPSIIAGEGPHQGPRGTDVRVDARLDGDD